MVTAIALLILLILCSSAGQFLFLLYVRKFGNWNDQIRLHDHGIWHHMKKEPMVLAVALFLLAWILENIGG